MAAAPALIAFPLPVVNAVGILVNNNLQTGRRVDGSSYQGLFEEELRYLGSAKGFKDLGCKVSIAVANWTELYHPNCPKEVRAFGGLAKDGKNAVALFYDMPKGIAKVGENITRLANGFSLQNVRKLFVSVANLGGPISDSALLLQGRVIHLSHATMEALQRLSHAGLLSA